MADTAQTPEAVAYALLVQIAGAEDWTGYGNATSLGNPWKKTRAEILDAYAACLQAAKGLRPVR